VIPLSDGAGDVVACGEGCDSRLQVGDRVAGIFFQTWIAGKLTREKIKSALGGCDRWNAGKSTSCCIRWSGSPAGSSFL